MTSLSLSLRLFAGLNVDGQAAQRSAVQCSVAEWTLHDRKECDGTVLSQAEILSQESFASLLATRNGTKGEGRSREEACSSSSKNAWHNPN